MQLHQLRPTTKHKRDKRVGRGGKRGTTSGRGTKGQRARAGGKIRPALRDVLKKLPKRRGYRFRSFASKAVVLNLNVIAKHFSSGETVTPAALLAKKLVRRIRGKIPSVKVLGQGEVGGKSLTFKGVAFSRSVPAKIK